MIAVIAVIAVIEVGPKDTGAIVTCDRSSDSSDSCFGHVGQFTRNMSGFDFLISGIVKMCIVVFPCSSVACSAL